MKYLPLILVFIWLITFFLFYTIQFFNLLFRGFAPFYSTRRNIIESIIDKIDIQSDDKVVELGCGKAGFLQAVRKKFPKQELIGYEYSFLPFVIAKIQNAFQQNNLEIRKVNFFNVDLRGADVVYCYLSIRTMHALETKFLAECQKGTRIVSYMFPLKQLKPTVVEEVQKGERVYYYTIK